MGKFNELDDFQKRSFLVFKAFHEFCVKNNLKYCLLGGSVLGAVRHQGFIPWDDDIDVGMPRDDYNKFIEISGDLPFPFRIGFPETDPESYLDFGKVYDASTTVVEDTIVKLKRGVWIDVFPLDGAFSNKLFRSFHFFLIKILRFFIGVKRGMIIKIDRGWVRNLIFFIVEKTTSKLDLIDLTKFLNKLLSLKNIDQSSFVANYLGRWGEREIQNRKNYLEFGKCFFVDGEYPVPAKLHEYLTAMYGNYMELPPVERRNSGHNFIEINLEKSYLDE